MGSVRDATVVITGAAGGLGLALAREYHRLGFPLALIDIDLEGLERARTALANGARVTIHQADVSNEQQVRVAKQQILHEHRMIGRLINNAAVSISLPFAQEHVPGSRALFDVNYWGCVHMSAHFLPELQKANDPRLVNISSVFEVLGFPGKSAYAASKAALAAFTRTLRTELRPSKLRVCLVIPPALDTGLVRNGAHADEVKRDQEVAFVKQRAMPIEQAAKRIVRGIERGDARIVVGMRMKVMHWFALCFPGIAHRLVMAEAQRQPFVQN